MLRYNNRIASLASSETIASLASSEAIASRRQSEEERTTILYYVPLASLAKQLLRVGRLGEEFSPPDSWYNLKFFNILKPHPVQKRRERLGHRRGRVPFGAKGVTTNGCIFRARR